MVKRSDIFKNLGYLILPNVLSAEVCDLLSKYAKLKAELNPKIRKGKDPLAHIHREYADPLMETLLTELMPQVEQASGLSLWPTLSFYYTYRHGNQLQPHTDRSSCEIVAGLCMGVDEDYQQTQGTWPLILEVAGKPVVLDLAVGDLVIFKGHEMKHWREPFTGLWFVSAIFAYVDKNGPYAFQKFDQRKALGKPHVGMFKWMLGGVRHRLRMRIKQFSETWLRRINVKI